MTSLEDGLNLELFGALNQVRGRGKVAIEFDFHHFTLMFPPALELLLTILWTNHFDIVRLLAKFSKQSSGANESGAGRRKTWNSLCL